MSLATVATVFAVIAVAELTDKTMIATVIMASRGEPLWVWIGASMAFLVHVGFAVVAGQLLTRLPHAAIEAVVAAMFLGGAAWLLVVREDEELARGRDEAARERPGRARAVVLGSFGVILLSEFADLTQLLTAGFVARTHQPASVALGSAAALVTVSGVASFSGRAILRVVPLAAIRRGGGIVLLGLAAVTLYQLASG